MTTRFLDCKITDLLTKRHILRIFHVKRTMLRCRFIVIASVVLLAGCGEATTPEPASSAPNASEVGAVDSLSVDSSEAVPAVDEERPMEFAPLSMNGGANTATTAANTTALGSANSEQQHLDIMKNLKPLQVMLGAWRGTTRKEYGISKAVDNHEWIWDLQTDPQQPALTLTSDKSPYLKAARLTWLPSTAKFQLKATNLDGVAREYIGDYTDPVHEIVGPDDKMHRVFRLELTETEASAEKAGGETWQVAFVQQQNDRYLLEIDKRRGKAAFRRYDTVSTQREGTSFALNDSDYGEKTCIISQGLGTIAVSYKGKSYWVCCTGCKAAFEAEPETWIARAEKAAMEE